MYFAKRRLKIGDEWREAGEPVPEAEGWATRQILVGAGYLEVRADDGLAAAGKQDSFLAGERDGEPLLPAAAEAVTRPVLSEPGDSQLSSKLKPRPLRRKSK